MSIAVSGRSHTIQANGLSHHLLEYGDARRGTILILPGITSPAATADFIAVALSDMGFRVVVPDLRGRGKTTVAASGNYRLADYAADVDGIVSALELGAPTIIGHSLGARIAAAYAVGFALHGHGHLILVDPPVSGPGRGPYPTNREAFLTQLHEAQQGTTVEQVRRFYPKWPERELQLRADILATCDETAVVETHEGFQTEDFFEYWTQIAPPATLVRGADSPVVPAQAAADLAAANPAIPILSVPGAGHMVPWDNFEGFFDVLAPLLPGVRKS